MKTFYVTTPIYYANSLPHMGHLYTTVVADFLTRYRRQRGYETYFLTGTDEHGTNIERASARAGRTPKEHVDYIVGELKQMFGAFGLDGEQGGGYDIFMRTTEPFHYEGAAEFWRRAAARPSPKGRENIYKGFYEGWFCAPCATFKTEAEMLPAVEEGGPPLCPIHERPLDKVSEESYFFRLSDYEEALLSLYESRPDFVIPEARRNEVASLVRGGLEDVSISRLKTSVSWAIPVPDDPQHTVYIWFDALINYITALGWGSESRKAEAGDLFEKFWPGLHLIGKDILRQHAVLWPAMLMAAGVELPRAVVAHGLWLDQTGRKGSKTLGNALELPVLLRHFQVDAVRYFLLREMSFGQDCKVDYEVILERSNSDLASGLGNLLSRTLTMIHKYFGGVVPADEITEARRLQAKRAGVDSDAQALSSSVELVRDQFVQNVEEYAFHRALEAAWGMIARVDKFISDAKPWELARDESQRETLGAVLYRAAETLRWLAALLHPVMPRSTRAVWKQLGLEEDPAQTDPTELKWGALRAGAAVGEVAPLFPRIDKVKTMAEIEKEIAQRKEAEAQTALPPSTTPSGTHATQAAVPGSPTAAETQPAQPPARGATEAQPVPSDAQAQPGAGSQAAQTPEGVATHITIEDFVKVELRVGEVLTAERVPKSDKLLRLTVDVGEPQPRQILAGIAEHYEPESLIGRKLVIVSNLKPRKLRGFESQGMVLAASVGEEGRPVLATFAEDVPNGTRLK